MKTQLCKTSSILIDIENSSFKKLNEEYSIYQFNLPSYIQEKINQYAFHQNWAKDNLNYPYYLNIPSKKLYVLAPKNEIIQDLTFEEKKLPFSLFNDFKSRNKCHLIIKLLLAKYFELTENFVSNDKFFLHANVNRSKTWATVLKIELSHNYKNTNAIEFFVSDEANRLKKISLDEYNKFYSKEIIYGQSIRNGQLFFKQLKRKEIKTFQGLLFTKPKTGFVGNTKSKINYHSIIEATGHESSKAYLLERFSVKFLHFINEFGIKASPKELNLRKVEIKNNRAELEIKNFNIALVDGRMVKKHSLNELFPNSEYFSFTEKTVAELKENNSCLFVMDYNKEDFPVRFNDETDPYKTFKESIEHTAIAKQGICINENYFDEDASDSEISKEGYLNYEGLNKDDFERNLSICVTQLYLKNILLNKIASNLPNNDVLKNHCFCFRNYLLYVESEELKIEKHESTEDLLNKVASKFNNLNIEKLFQDIYSYHNPFPTTKDFDFLNHKLIFSNSSVIEIIDIPERSFYDEDEIKLRIADRNKQRPKTEFKSIINDSISNQFNNFIDEDVENIMISYEELKAKYGKGESGFLKQIFGSKDERPFIKFLNANTCIQVKGLKQDSIFSIYSGVWFDEVLQQYFVGRTHGYQHKQDKGSQMKKVITHFGSFNEHMFFELLNVDFIRYKEMTVNPYPFKLIEIFQTITNSLTMENSK